MSNSISLDRMEIEEAGFNPELLAQAVHKQLVPNKGAVPIIAIAQALDIKEICYEPLTNFEGALVMPSSRSHGAILINSLAKAKRQRFTIAHELGHYLNLRHQPQSDNGFECSRQDMRQWKHKVGLSLYQRQELEANRFAIELLAPTDWLIPYQQQTPDLTQILELARKLELSKEAAARRFVELSDYPMAIIFSKDNQCRYWQGSPNCPPLSLAKMQKLPSTPNLKNATNPSHFIEIDPDDWLRHPGKTEVQLQVLNQHNGYSMMLLLAEEPEPDGTEEEDGIEDSYQRFDRFQSR